VQEKLWRNENYWVSPFNFIPEVTAGNKDLPKKVLIHDATMRDGEQTPGVVFRLEDKVRIAKYLDELGVDRIEVALPAVSEEDQQSVREVVKLNLKAKIFCLSRATESDIDLAAACGADGILLELPVGTPRLLYQFKNWNEDKVIDATLHCLDYARGKGLDIVLFPMDISRSEPEFFERFLAAIAAHGNKPDSIALVDTCGCLLPQAAAYMVRRMREVTGCSVEIHTHNDLEMGVAVPLAAVAAGAEVVHCSVGGIGERTGNTPLEAVVVALKTLLGVELNVDIGSIYKTMHAVLAMANVRISPSKPIIGEQTFTRESGMGINLIKEQPLAMYALNPKFLGREANYVLGKKSGILSVRMKLADLGITGVSEEEEQEIMKRVKLQGIERKRLVSDEEFTQIVSEVQKAE
jgi:isopropylmalate/homocitrate/citramalate synthase